MATLINKIALRTDTIQNWNALSSQVLLNGEVAIVLTDEKLPLFKIGDGIHKFYELPYSTKKISSDFINATDIIANSICQGIGSTAVPQGIAAGLNVHSNAIFSQAFGNNTTSKDIYSFTWNGKPDQDATNPYQSHDIGSFNVNPKDGPKGIYIGEQTLPEVISSCIPEVDLSEYCKKSETSSAIEISDAIQSAAATTKDYVDSKFDTIPTDYAKISVDNEAVQDFKMLHISYDEHAQLVNDKSIDPHTIYVLSADGYDDQFGNRIINLGSPISADDAATKNYVDSEIAKIPQPDLTEFVKLSSESAQDISSNLSIDGCLSVRNLVVQDSSVGVAKWGSIEGNVEDQTDLVKVNYPLDNPTVSSEIVDDITYKRFDIKDHTIATISLSDTTPVRIHFPDKPTENFCRDFIVKIKVTSETMPQVYFVKADNDSDIGFEYADENWTTLEAGINYFTFTETERS